MAKMQVRTAIYGWNEALCGSLGPRDVGVPISKGSRVVVTIRDVNVAWGRVAKAPILSHLPCFATLDGYGGRNFAAIMIGRLVHVCL